MQSLPKSKLGQIQVGSNIAQIQSASPQEVISGQYLYPIHMKSWPNMKLGQIQVGSNIAQNHSASP